MISELIILSTVAIVGWNWEKIKIKHRWKQITFSSNKFLNNLDKRPKLWSISDKGSYVRLKVELPYSYTQTDFERDLPIFKEGLQYDSISLKSQHNMVFMDCVRNYSYLPYKPIKLEPYKLLIADRLGKPIIVNMNSFPHMLIGGDTGTGKSRILLAVISNLIYSSDDIDLYLLQIRKGDLGVFRDCRQVKCYSTNLDDVFECLSFIDKECMRRERLIDNTLGYYNIQDYNTKSGEDKLNYIYVVVEEFSFLNVSKGDDKETKAFKNSCLKFLKNLINVGRASGIFLITSLQKPTNDSIPTDIKSQLCTRVSLFIKDEPTSRVILDNSMATTLNSREVIVRTLTSELGYTYSIEHEDVLKTIKGSVYKAKELETINNIPLLPQDIEYNKIEKVGDSIENSVQSDEINRDDNNHTSKEIIEKDQENSKEYKVKTKILDNKSNRDTSKKDIRSIINEID